MSEKCQLFFIDITKVWSKSCIPVVPGSSKAIITFQSMGKHIYIHKFVQKLIILVFHTLLSHKEYLLHELKDMYEATAATLSYMS